VAAGLQTRLMERLPPGPPVFSEARYIGHHQCAQPDHQSQAYGRERPRRGTGRACDSSSRRAR